MGGSSILGDDVIYSRAYHLFRCIFTFSFSKNVGFFSSVPTTQNLHVIHGSRQLFNISLIYLHHNEMSVRQIWHLV
jgi:hypothetical protein